MLSQKSNECSLKSTVCARAKTRSGSRAANPPAGCGKACSPSPSSVPRLKRPRKAFLDLSPNGGKKKTEPPPRSVYRVHYARTRFREEQKNNAQKKPCVYNGGISDGHERKKVRASRPDTVDAAVCPGLRHRATVTECRAILQDDTTIISGCFCFSQPAASTSHTRAQALFDPKKTQKTRLNAIFRGNGGEKLEGVKLKRRPPYNTRADVAWWKRRPLRSH